MPIIGIDFSLANVTFDDRKMVHSVKEENQNKYRDILMSISKSFRQISPSSLLYGFGAKTIKKKGETSHLFVASGDLLNPIVQTDNIENTYYECLKRIEIGFPTYLAGVLKKAVEFAENADIHYKEREEEGAVLSYFVVYILAAGIVDDLADCI